MLRLLLAALLLLAATEDGDAGPLHAAKTGSRGDRFTRLLAYMKSYPETLEQLMNRKYAVSEGDILMSDDRNAVESTWPTAEIAYDVSPDVGSRTDDITAAMAKVSQHTCVTFHRRTSETNFLMFTASKGCASYVGFIGGEQPVFIGPQCSVGNVVHELLHALGFHHEHTRTDRHQHITIMKHNIMEGMEKNFKERAGRTFDLKYDLSSIMHYGSGFFSSNGLPTIVSSSEVKDMGQRDRLTASDIQRVRLLYGCDGPRKAMTGVSSVDEETEEETEEEKEEEKDVHLHITFNDMKSSPGTKTRTRSPRPPEEDHTAAAERRHQRAPGRQRRGGADQLAKT